VSFGFSCRRFFSPSRTLRATALFVFSSLYVRSVAPARFLDLGRSIVALVPTLAETPTRSLGTLSRRAVGVPWITDCSDGVSVGKGISGLLAGYCGSEPQAARRRAREVRSVRNSRIAVPSAHHCPTGGGRNAQDKNETRRWRPDRLRIGPINPR